MATPHDGNHMHECMRAYSPSEPALVSVFAKKVAKSSHNNNDKKNLFFLHPFPPELLIPKLVAHPVVVTSVVIIVFFRLVRLKLLATCKVVVPDPLVVGVGVE
jgi:hypothetical protein